MRFAKCKNAKCYTSFQSGLLTGEPPFEGMRGNAREKQSAATTEWAAADIVCLCVYCAFLRENHPSSRAGFFSKAAIFSRMDCGMRMDSFFW